jgi:hypothetical protein
MLTLASVLVIAQVASQLGAPREEPPGAALPADALLLSAHLSSLSDERFGSRVEEGLLAVGGGAAVLAAGALAVHLAGAEPGSLWVPAAVGGGIISFGVVRLLVPTSEEELARKYHRAIARASEGGALEISNFEDEWKALLVHERAGRTILAGAYGLAGVAGVAASAYLAITYREQMTPALLVSTAATAAWSMVYVGYGAYLWTYFESPVERVWRQYVRSRSALGEPKSAAHNLSFGVTLHATGSMVALSGAF